MTQMRNRIRKMKRDWLVGRVVANGRKLRRYQVARNGVDGTLWPDDCAYLDANINILERRHDAMLRKLKED